jgi:L-fuconolactonase
LLDLADHHSFIAAVVGWVDLRSPQAEKQLLALARNAKLAGVRHIVQSEPDERFMLRQDFMRGIALLENFDLGYDILIYPQHLPVAAELIRRFERQRFVLDHLAKPQIRSGEFRSWSHGIRELARFQNTFCKLSGLVTEGHWQNWKPEDFRAYLDVAFECFGPNRLMIGSDWPVCTVAGEYSRVMDIVTTYIETIPSVARDAVMGGTARRFYQCKDGSTSLSSL